MLQAFVDALGRNPVNAATARGAIAVAGKIA
jgi:hypothetical protein